MQDNDEIENKEPSLADMLGMSFNEDGSMASISDIGESKMFRKLNHKERRIRAAIERRRKKHERKIDGLLRNRR